MTTTIPATTWQPQQGQGEYSLISAAAIVNTTGTALVDINGTALVDIDTQFTHIPATTWSINDGS